MEKSVSRLGLPDIDKLIQSIDLDGVIYFTVKYQEKKFLTLTTLQSKWRAIFFVFDFFSLFSIFIFFLGGGGGGAGGQYQDNGWKIGKGHP